MCIQDEHACMVSILVLFLGLGLGLGLVVCAHTKIWKYLEEFQHDYRAIKGLQFR